MANGWTGNILRVNLTTGNITLEDSSKFKSFVGGMGFGYKIMYDEVPPGTKPFDEANKLVFATGPLTGSGAPCSSRVNITSLSTFTKGNLVVDAHMGGFFAAQMKFAGYDVIIIEGKAKSPVWLKIKDDKVSLEKADFLWGKGTRATTEEICRLTSPETCVAAIGQAGEKLANTRQEKEVRYAMIHDESRCNGCNICARACRKTNHVPAQGSRLSIAHIPVTDNDNETQYHFFRQSCQHCEDAPCIDVCPTGASWRDEQGIVRVEKSQCIGCSYCIGACPYQVRYLNPVTKVADKCDFCAESRLAKGFPPICVSACPEHALIFGREDSPEIQAWLQQNKYYQYQLPGAGKPHLYRRFGQHLIKKENV